MRFDADALLAALPVRQIKPISSVRARGLPNKAPLHSALGQKGEYNGFSLLERNRTARLSSRLMELGATIRPSMCDICGGRADDEHAENYYDLSRWVGLCRSCRRHALHNRVARPAKWVALLDQFDLPDNHWSRLLAPEPFDLAQLMRDRGVREPGIIDFVADDPNCRAQPT